MNLKNQQSLIKNQGANPTCLIYSTIAAIEEYLIKVGKPQILDEIAIQGKSEAITLEATATYAPGSTDKALTWAVRKGLIPGYKVIKKGEIIEWINKGCSVIASTSKIENRDIFHNILIISDDYEYKNSWGVEFGNKGYGLLDPNYIIEPCYVIPDLIPDLLANTSKLIKPVNFPVTQGYGENVAYYNTKALGFTLGHPGIDFGCPVGTPIECSADGVLQLNKTITGALVMTVQHDFGTTEYWHLSRTIGLAGDKVKQGDVICWSGNSGKFVKGKGHLHFELHPIGGGNPQMNGTVDPTPYFTYPQTYPQPSQKDIDIGLQNILSYPIPKFSWMFGLGYPGGRVNWALAHRKNIFNLYLQYFSRVPNPWEVDYWLRTSPNIKVIESGFKQSDEYNNK